MLYFSPWLWRYYCVMQTLGLAVLSFQYGNDVVLSSVHHCFWWEVSHNLDCSPVLQCISAPKPTFGFFWGFYLPFAYSHLMVVCIDVVVFVFILLGFYWNSRINMSKMFWLLFSQIIFSSSFSFSPPSPLWVFKCTCVRQFEIVPWVTEAISFFLIFFVFQIWWILFICLPVHWP